MTTVNGSLHGRLPAEVNRFIGRRSEVTESKRLLSVTRLLTLTGVGGVGKTRLAFRVAAEMQRAFADGVLVVELADLRNAGLLANTVATSVGLAEQSGRWRVTALIEHIADKQILIILDNCEHLVDACAVLVSSLLRACQHLRILATSRQPLNVTGESILPVAPLPVPDSQYPPPVSELAQYDAVKLFMDRADAVAPGFSITEDNYEAVTKLCQRLDGLPLAMELAAVRLRVLAIDDVLARLDDRFRLLAAGSRGAPERQQTLQACIDWSFDLCSPNERILWSRLSLFSGVFDVAAAEGICGADGLVTDDIFDLVASLVDKSVLQQEPRSSPTGFRMLETLRQYGEAKLKASGQYAAQRRRFVDWYLRLIEQANSEWISSAQIEWIDRLRRNHANIRTVLDFCSIDPDESSLGLRIVLALEPYWLARGMLGEARHWLERLLDHTETNSAMRSRALRLDAWFATLQGNTADAASQLREAERFASQTDDALAVAYSAQTSAMFSVFQRDLGEGLTRLQDALARFRAVSDLLGEVSTLFLLGMTAELSGAAQSASEWLQECIELTERCGECQWRGNSLWALGLNAMNANNLSRATELEQEALRLRKQFDGQSGIATALEALGMISAAENRNERAATLFGAADRLYRSMGGPYSTMLPALHAYRVRAEAGARRALGDTVFQAALDRGSTLSRNQALSLALNEKLGTVRASPTLRPTDPVPLTRRELEVADLVARGLTNKEIAHQLVIAPRTAEGHVEHILNKLGFNKRVQIAAWVIERRQYAPR